MIVFNSTILIIYTRKQVFIYYRETYCCTIFYRYLTASYETSVYWIKMGRFAVFILWIGLLQLATGIFSQTTCTYLNDDCGRLPEFMYKGTRSNPTTIYYQQSTIRLSNGAVFPGRRLSFTAGGGGESNSPYLGVWRIPKGTTLFVRFINQSPFNGNLHWHGLHVKGTNADDPTVIVNPASEHRYEFDIGRDHSKCVYHQRNKTRINQLIYFHRLQHSWR